MTNIKDINRVKGLEDMTNLALVEKSDCILAKSNVKDIRRENTRALARAIGGISALAKLLGKAQSQISRLIGRTPTKNIGDKLAAEIEIAFHKPYGWLDREHPGITLPLEEYEAVSEVKLETVPLITWQDALEWCKRIERYAGARFPHAEKRIPAFGAVSHGAYALTIEDESMVASQGLVPLFPLGSIIIVEPNDVPKHGDYVVAALKEATKAVLRQWVVKETACVLQPLNTRYPTIDSDESTLVCGVVRTLIVSFP